MSKKLEERDPAPSFTVATSQGEMSSKSLRGEPYVLYFYPRDDTPGCTKEAIAFSGLADEFAKLGVALLGISKDSVQSHEKFARNTRWAFRLGPIPIRAWPKNSACGWRRNSTVGSTWAWIARPF